MSASVVESDEDRDSMCLPLWSRGCQIVLLFVVLVLPFVVLSVRLTVITLCVFTASVATCLDSLSSCQPASGDDTPHHLPPEGNSGRQQGVGQHTPLTLTTGRECRTGPWSPRYAWGSDFPTQSSGALASLETRSGQWLPHTHSVWLMLVVRVLAPMGTETQSVGVWSPRNTRGALTSSHRARALASLETQGALASPIG